jgi:hypothetical protein
MDWGIPWSGGKIRLLCGGATEKTSQEEDKAQEKKAMGPTHMSRFFFCQQTRHASRSRGGRCERSFPRGIGSIFQKKIRCLIINESPLVRPLRGVWIPSRVSKAWEEYTAWAIAPFACTSKAEQRESSRVGKGTVNESKRYPCLAGCLSCCLTRSKHSRRVPK